MLTPWYVTGFCDGEAAFTYSRSGGTFILYFSVKQREGNSILVEKIREFFRFTGSIYKVKQATLKRPNKNSGPTTYFRVTKANELKVIVDHFDKYPLQSKKQQVYMIWREMVLHKIGNYRSADYGKMKALAEKLSGLNTTTGN